MAIAKTAEAKQKKGNPIREVRHACLLQQFARDQTQVAEGRQGGKIHEGFATLGGAARRRGGPGGGSGGGITGYVS